MADRAERRASVYDHKSSKKARGDSEPKPKVESEPAPAKRASEDKPAEKTTEPTGGADDLDGRQKGERDEMQRRHEVERRDMGNAHRDEERTMNARHESEYGA